MKPLLKWAGGKRQIADELFSHFPKGWDSHTFIEPFIGGGAMFLHLGPKVALIADLNKRLVGFYKFIKSSPVDMENGVLQLAQKFDEVSPEEKKEFFLNLRNEFNASDPNSIQSAVQLYALNKLCFNGLYRENSKGFFNVPFGQKKRFPELEIGTFQQASDLLKGAEIINADFETTLGKAIKGDFVYLDPPYIPIDATSSFTSYHADGFGLEDQKRLATKMLEMKENQINAMCSNSDTLLTREIFSSLEVRTIQAPRMVSAKASGRGMISELVITNY